MRRMSRRPTALLLATLVAATGCAATSTSSRPAMPAIDANRAVARRMIDDLWNKGILDDAILAEIFAPTITAHLGGHDRPFTRDAGKKLVAYWRQAMPDFHFDLADTIAEGDKVALRLTFSGTQSGPLLDLAPSGKHATVTEMLFLRFENGKIVELWEDWDEHGMRQQLGGN